MRKQERGSYVGNVPANREASVRVSKPVSESDTKSTTFNIKYRIMMLLGSWGADCSLFPNAPLDENPPG